jgi:hypothetical protein
LVGVIGNLIIFLASVAERIREIGFLFVIIFPVTVGVKLEYSSNHRAARLNFNGARLIQQDPAVLDF